MQVETEEGHINLGTIRSDLGDVEMDGLPGESQAQDPGLQEVSGDGNSRKEDGPATETEITEVDRVKLWEPWKDECHKGEGTPLCQNSREFRDDGE